MEPETDNDEQESVLPPTIADPNENKSESFVIDQDSGSSTATDSDNSSASSGADSDTSSCTGGQNVNCNNGVCTVTCSGII